MDVSSLAARLLDGERHALARAITVVENEREGTAELMAALFPRTGNAHRVGITGPSGTGKSTLVNALAKVARQRELTVGIVAVDPTSPFTGGAILGDRIRMRDLAGDPGIFIRSMATRGSLGGLARATSDVVDVLDAAGFDVVLIETVGAGQSEVEIAQTAYTTVVIDAPGLGDDIQAIKAGILEIADVLVVNKADLPRADHTYRVLRGMLGMNSSPPAYAGHHGPLTNLTEREQDGGPQDSAGDGWKVPVLKTIATEDDGITDLLDAIQAHQEYLVGSGGLAARKRARVAADLEMRLRDSLLAQLLARINSEDVSRAIEDVLERRLDPRAAVTRLIGNAEPMTER